MKCVLASVFVPRPPSLPFYSIEYFETLNTEDLWIVWGTRVGQYVAQSGLVSGISGRSRDLLDSSEDKGGTSDLSLLLAEDS